MCNLQITNEETAITCWWLQQQYGYRQSPLND